MTEEYYEKHYGEFLAQMAEDIGLDVEVPTDEDLEEMLEALRRG